MRETRQPSVFKQKHQQNEVQARPTGNKWNECRNVIRMEPRRNEQIPTGLKKHNKRVGLRQGDLKKYPIHTSSCCSMSNRPAEFVAFL